MGHDFPSIALQGFASETPPRLPTADKHTNTNTHEHVIQLPPAAEVKVVRCVRGALWDVILDLRAGSASFGKWFGAELSAQNRTMMYVPRGFAHGFVTLTDDAEAIYLVSAAYSPDNERGVRYDDPAVGIEWPLQPMDISDKDRNWPDLDADFHAFERMRNA